MKCPTCKNEIGNDLFCKYCGTKIEPVYKPEPNVEDVVLKKAVFSKKQESFSGQIKKINHKLSILRIVGYVYTVYLFFILLFMQLVVFDDDGEIQSIKIVFSIVFAIFGVLYLYILSSKKRIVKFNLFFIFSVLFLICASYFNPCIQESAYWFFNLINSISSAVNVVIFFGFIILGIVFLIVNYSFNLTYKTYLRFLFNKDTID